MKKILFLFLVFLGISANGYCGYHFAKKITSGAATSSATVEIDDDGSFTMVARAYSTCTNGGFSRLTASFTNGNYTFPSISLFAREDDLTEVYTYKGHVSELKYNYYLVCLSSGYSAYELYFYW